MKEAASSIAVFGFWAFWAHFLPRRHLESGKDEGQYLTILIVSAWLVNNFEDAKNITR